MSTQTSVPPGWYPDTSTSGMLRWWDGQRWTNHTQPDPKATPVPATPAHTATVADTAPTKRKPGLFGGGNKRKLEDEVEELRSALSAAGALSAFEMSRETERVRAQLAQAVAELATTQAKAQEDLSRARAELAAIRTQVVETNEIAQLQEAGVYAYAHPLSDAVGYKDLLARVKADTKALISAGRAVYGSTSWQVNGSAAQGRKMVSDFSKLLLRAYNAEADNCVRTVKPHSRKATLERLSKAAATIEKLGKTMDIRITSEYHRARLYEIELTADYLAKVEEARERTRAEREQLRDQQLAEREMEREKARLAKEQAHYQNALAKALAGDASQEAIHELEAKLAETGAELEKVISREANIRAGYVYVISNIGAFGEGMVKIGLTRRMEPMDRVRELGDASVPFRFDVHALIFSNDAVGLETRLHQALADRKVNQINQAREFFYANPAEVRELLAKIDGSHLLEYTELPEAAEWRASGSRRSA